MNIGFAGLLALIFITLKLTGAIAWSWLWILFPVLWPLYGVALFTGITIVFIGLMGFIIK